ncbi:MAG TPA: DUF2493 domain-containing protein [Bradyrhizobium sp.]|nr:DUF2493 domain-containing protein [Bradyrhizobium sp.]
MIGDREPELNRFVVLVCGGRDYADAARVDRILNAALRKHAGALVIVNGGATGADYLASRWADRNGVPCVEMPAPWSKHGAAAGPIRNRWMLDLMRPDRVVAFPGGRGTADMVAAAREAVVQVIDLRAPPQTLREAAP